MLKIDNIEVSGFKAALRGMRNPMNSWANSDSWDLKTGYMIGDKDHDLAMKLSKAGSVHAKFRRMITVTLDVTAPLYWWKEFDTYKVGTVRNSCSTMHKIHSKEFELDDFSHEHLCTYSHDGELCRDWKDSLEALIDDLNAARKLYVDTNNKEYWWQLIQLLPSSYNQKATVQLNYQVLANIYKYRKDHKLDEWRIFCKEMKDKLPYSELFTESYEE